MKIEIGKKYTSNGSSVRILAVDLKDPVYPVVAACETDIGTETLMFFTEDGKYFDKGLSYNDLEEYHEFMDFKVDDQVMVRNNYPGSLWCRRMFAGVSEKGKPLAFEEGRCSWTARGTTPWDECRRPTKEELEKHNGA